MKDKITELAIGGGGTSGMAYVGALKYLDEHGILKNIKKIAASSIGSLLGTLVAVGYSSDELLEIGFSLDFEVFGDSVGGTDEVLPSLFRGEKYEKFIRECLEKKNKKFFRDLDIDLIITGCCISPPGSKICYFSKDKTPDMELCTAIKISCSIPLIFPSINYEGKQYIDGALLNNLPINALAENAIGIRTCRDATENHHNIETYLLNILHLFSQHLEKLQIEKWKKNVIRIQTDDFGPLDFNLTYDKKLTLFYRGYLASRNFLKTWKCLPHSSDASTQTLENPSLRDS